MTFRQLQYFIAVADQLNFSRAADSLYISQPTLSQQISELEEELGVKLLVRNKRYVALTPAGATLVQGAKDLLLRSEKLIETTRRAAPSTDLNKSICIGFEEVVVQEQSFRFGLTNAVAQFRKNNPSIRVFFRSIDYFGLEKALKGGEIDVGFSLRPDTRLEPPVTGKPLRRDQLVLVVHNNRRFSNSREETMRLLNTSKIFLLDKDFSALCHVLKLFSKLGVAPQTMFFENSSTISLLVESGDGVMILPSTTAQKLQHHNLQILNFHDEEASLYLVAAWNKNNTNSLIHPLLNSIDLAQ